MSDENIQLIFCVESTKKAAIDSKYINEVLKHYYDISENKISYVYMSGKYNYNQAKTLKEIKKYIKEYQITGNGKSYVLYVFDKDLNTKDHRDAQFEDDVKRYCLNEKHQLIWFVQTVEDVMWGCKVSKKDKTKKALQFIRNRQIKNINKANLEAHYNVNASHKSNILTILNKFNEIQRN